jgi:hypothetical protein
MTNIAVLGFSERVLLRMKKEFFILTVHYDTLVFFIVFSANMALEQILVKQKYKYET